MFNIMSIPITYDSYEVIDPCLIAINMMLQSNFKMFVDFENLV